MRELDNDFLIDGKPILIPDEGLEMEFNDLDAEESGRDESGIMHRVVLRRKVKKWAPVYAVLTGEEYQYMESLFEGKDEFVVTFPNVAGEKVTCTAYRSKYGIVLHNHKTGVYKNYKFNIIEC